MQRFIVSVNLGMQVIMLQLEIYFIKAKASKINAAQITRQSTSSVTIALRGHRSSGRGSYSARVLQEARERERERRGPPEAISRGLVHPSRPQADVSVAVNATMLYIYYDVSVTKGYVLGI